MALLHKHRALCARFRALSRTSFRKQRPFVRRPSARWPSSRAISERFVFSIAFFAERGLFCPDLGRFRKNRCLSSMCTKYRARLQRCRGLLQKYWALLQSYRAHLWICFFGKTLGSICRQRGLFDAELMCRKRWLGCENIGLLRRNTGLNCENIRLFCGKYRLRL